MLKKIAITGNIGCGKTEALKIFKKLGSYTINTDDIVHTLLKNDKELKIKIINIFGEKILKNDKIDRKKIAKIVFSDENKLKKLEKLIHPKVLNKILLEYDKVKDKNFEFFIVEIPLLFEIKYQKYFDVIITISAKDTIAKKRYKDKDYEFRKKRQMPISEKEELSDFVIENNLNISDLEKNIKKVLKIIKNF